MFILYLKDVTINCESVKLREFKLSSFTVYLTHNSYINNLLPYKNYTIQIKVTNNKDLAMEDMMVIETLELGTYFYNTKLNIYFCLFVLISLMESNLLCHKIIIYIVF